MRIRRARHASGELTHAEELATHGLLPDLRRLYAFTVVAEELHFRGAAKRLLMAQSPLSRMIKNLERDLGVTLFERTRSSVGLTRAGKVLYREMREILARAERAISDARSTGESEP